MDIFYWSGSYWLAPRVATPSRVVLIDSWRHCKATACRLDLHAVRFKHAVESVGFFLPIEEWGAVWSGVLTTLNSEHYAPRNLFPRISLVESPEKVRQLQLEVREAPRSRVNTSLTYFSGQDPRQFPQLKGPDLDTFSTLRTASIGSEADDVVISDYDGACLEATTGAIVVWNGGTLVVSDRVEKQLPSVTLFQVVEKARSAGLPIEFRSMFPTDLASGPVWFLNSLHGISPVSRLHIEESTLIPPSHPEEEDWVSWWWSEFFQPDVEFLSAINSSPHPDLSHIISQTRSKNND